MEFLEQTRRMSVREGFVVLLRAEANLQLPSEDYEKIRSFYQKTADSCLLWATEIYGEELRRSFLSLSDIREKSRFRTRHYRFWMRVPWSDGEHVTILCESTRESERGDTDFYRIAHTWNVAEQTILPTSQVLRLLGARPSTHALPFVPNGLYKEGETIVIYQNASAEKAFSEVRFPVANP